MKGSFFKVRIRRSCQRAFSRIASRYPHDELERAAVVFSPQCDDETLGSGGTNVK